MVRAAVSRQAIIGPCAVI